MRRLSIMSGLVAAACLFAIVATASGHQFTASSVSKPFPLKVSGKGEEESLRFGKYKVECGSAIAVGGSITESPTPEFRIEQRPKECVDVEGRWENTPTEPKVRFADRVEFKLRANESTEIGEPEEMEVGPIVIHIAHTGGCTVKWPRQVVPLRSEGSEPGEGEFKAVEYTPLMEPSGNVKSFPSGFQERLLVTYHLKNMKYEYGTGGLCENFEPGEKVGSKLEGEVELHIAGGNISWE